MVVPGLRPFSFAALLAGARIYEFEEFYDAKNALLRFDDRRDYLNYGMWNAGDATKNPSAELVRALAAAAEVGPGDTVLTLGSGLGQPDLDLAELGVLTVVGLNIHPGQVAYANARAREAGLAAVVQHRHADAQRLTEAVGDLNPTRVLAIESLAEMPDLSAVLAAAYATLAPGGRFAMCDVVVEERPGLTRRSINRVLTRVTSVLYGDTWRTRSSYVRALRDAGFTGIEARSIGSAVYAPTFRHARRQLRERRRFPRAATAMTIAYINLRALERLHWMGAVDYAILSAQKARR